jgi:hypothetical protein
MLLAAYQTYRDAVLLKGTPQATWTGYSTAVFRGQGRGFDFIQVQSSCREIISKHWFFSPRQFSMLLTAYQT